MNYINGIEKRQKSKQAFQWSTKKAVIKRTDSGVHGSNQYIHNWNYHRHCRTSCNIRIPPQIITSYHLPWSDSGVVPARGHPRSASTAAYKCISSGRPSAITYYWVKQRAPGYLFSGRCTLVHILNDRRPTMISMHGCIAGCRTQANIFLWRAAPI